MSVRTNSPNPPASVWARSRSESVPRSPCDRSIGGLELDNLDDLGVVYEFGEPAVQ